MKTKTAFVVLAALASAASWGCGSASTSEKAGTIRTSLHRSKSCGDLLTDLKADASYKVNHGIDQQIAMIQACVAHYGENNCAGYGYGYGGGDYAAGAPEATGGTKNSGAAAPSTPGSGTQTSDSATSYSETNTQVKGVDEADIVKNDGNNLYVLHGRAFKVVKAWPASDLHELSSTDIEGQPSEMFVADGRAVIYSQVNGASLFAAAGVTPKATYTDFYGAPMAGGMGGGGGIASSPAVDTPESPSAPPGEPQQYIPLTKVTVLSLDAGAPTVAREMYFEGNYLSARRVGANVRTVLSSYAHGPALKYGIYEYFAQPSSAPTRVPGGDGSGASAPVAPPAYPSTATEVIAALERLRGDNLAIIAGSTLNDWIPYTFVKNGASVQAHTVACEDFYVPTAGSTAAGLTEVASIDLADPTSVPRETAILGRVDTVYGSADTLYLAAQAWVESPVMWSDVGVASSGGETVASPPPSNGTTTDPGNPPSGTGGAVPKSVKPLTTPAGTTSTSITAWPTNMTHVHKFEFASDPKFPNYVASGTVSGSVHNQFSLDDKDGFLRIATTENRLYVDSDGRYVSPTFTTGGAPPALPNSVSHVYVLGVNGGWLDLKGDVGEIAANEQIQSVRFVDNRGYVVTFRRTDPLFVLDLQNPVAPTLLGELTIPGFSEYMHPLDENHLLTIGRDADATGRTRGLQLQIFDVTDGLNPVVLKKFTYSASEYGASDAEYDHKAFTYFADKQLLAFPYYSYGSSSMRSSLELFKVDIASGFSKLGSVDGTSLVSSAPQGYCGGYYGPQVRRGVFLENFVYSISYGGVVAKDSSNLAAPGASLPLSAPETNTGYGPYCAVDAPPADSKGL